ncbi:hypothetical protein Tco_0729059 [Tanacetum coccineum]|uniref:Transposase n=1 Tax=Tanacetum coccineum TaxID=301880 RepID=A0ABQ4YRC1_9ASTR
MYADALSKQGTSKNPYGSGLCYDYCLTFPNEFWRLRLSKKTIKPRSEDVGGLVAGAYGDLRNSDYHESHSQSNSLFTHRVPEKDVQDMKQSILVQCLNMTADIAPMLSKWFDVFKSQSRTPKNIWHTDEVEVLWGVMEWCRVGRVVVGDTQLRPTLLLYRFIDPFPQLGDTEEFETDESARYT